jgi:hypothetical protein
MINTTDFRRSRLIWSRALEHGLSMLDGIFLPCASFEPFLA